MAKALDWTRDGSGWPNRAASRFVDAGGIRWHVQRMGRGPVLLLVHGTGASTHSWRVLLPLLAAHFDVVAFDLPGHGFTAIAPGDGMSLPGMSRLIEALLHALGVAPAVAVGHSGGAAVIARMILDRRLAPRAFVSVNGAFVPFEGVLRFLSPIARLMASTSLAARVFAARAADPKAVDRLLASTGSRLDGEGVALYRRLVRSPSHVHGALAMMASWNLDSLEREMASLQVPALFVAGASDGTVPPAQAARVAARVRSSRVESLAGLGHLAHEEDPARVAALIESFAASVSPPLS